MRLMLFLSVAIACCGCSSDSAAPLERASHIEVEGASGKLARSESGSVLLLERLGSQRATLIISTARASIDESKVPSAASMFTNFPMAKALQPGVVVEAVDAIAVWIGEKSYAHSNLARKFIALRPGLPAAPDESVVCREVKDGVILVYHGGDAGSSSITGLLVTIREAKPVYFEWNDERGGLTRIADKLAKAHN